MLTFLNLIGLLNLVLTVVLLSSISFGFTFTSALGRTEEVAKSGFLGLALDLTLFLSKVGVDDDGDKVSDESSTTSLLLACCLILNFCFGFIFVSLTLLLSRPSSNTRGDTDDVSLSSYNAMSM